MKQNTLLNWMGLLLAGAVLSTVWVSADSSRPKGNRVIGRAAPAEPEPVYTPFAVGAVRMVNGIGTIEHPKLDWDSIPIFTLYTQEAAPGSVVTVYSAVAGRLEIRSTDPNDHSIYTFAIYDGKTPGIIFPPFE